MDELVRSYTPYSWPKRLAIFFGIPLATCVPIIVLLRVFDPVHTLDCRRTEPGANVHCEVASRSWGSDPPPRTFLLDGATIEVQRIGSGGRRASTRLQLEVTPVGEPPLQVSAAGEPTRAALQRMLADREQLELHHDDDASGFFVAMLPIAFALVTVPLLALGGRIDLVASRGRIAVRRTRAWIRGRERVVEARAGERVVLDVHHYGGRWRGMARLSAQAGATTTVLVAQAPSAVVERLAADLRAALDHSNK